MSDCGQWLELDARRLRQWPLPEVNGRADKDERGRVLVVAGSREIPGAAVLAATAALRAGAGKLQIATAQSVARQMAFAVPEARVLALPETEDGALSTKGLPLLRESAERADAALIGPGFMGEQATIEFVAALLPLLARAPVLLDALAMSVVAGAARRFDQPVVLTPHAGEMAHLSGRAKEEVIGDAREEVARAATQWNCVVALKGATTLIAAPEGGRWIHQGGRPGLATSGSGDVLSGIVAGLVARGASLEQACAWGVVLHASSATRLAARGGPIGFLARELPGEIPALVHRLGRRARGG